MVGEYGPRMLEFVVSLVVRQRVGARLHDPEFDIIMGANDLYIGAHVHTYRMLDTYKWN